MHVAYIFLSVFHKSKINKGVRICTMSTEIEFYCSDLCSVVNSCTLEDYPWDIGGRWESTHSLNWPIGEAHWSNTTLYLHPLTNHWTESHSLPTSLSPKKSNPILLKLNGELTNPVRGTGNNLFSIWKPAQLSLDPWLFHTFTDQILHSDCYVYKMQGKFIMV